MPAFHDVAIIGHTGHGDYGHGIDTVWLDLPECQIVGVADANEKGRAAAVKRLTQDGRVPPTSFADYREMLAKAEPSIVAICPRHLGEHRDMVIAAANSGAHIYMEKPFARTLAEADEMIAALNKNKVKLAIAHQTRYSPKLHVVRALIEDGRIGKVLELRGRGKEDHRGGGEDLWVLGSHVFNLMQYFAGEPTSCTARVLWQGKPVTKENVFDGPEGIGPLAGDNVAAMYEFPEGVMGYFNSVRGMGNKGTRFGLQIFGSEGCIEVTTGHLAPMTLLADPLWSPGRSGKTWTPITTAGAGAAETMKDGGLHAGNVLAVKDLLAAIEEDRQPECNAYEARWTIEMIAGVFDSQRTGGPVKLPLENRQNPLAML